MENSTKSVYVLELDGGKYYVGTSNDVQARFEEHQNGQGSEWTRLYHPIRILETRSECTGFDEDMITKIYMSKKGIQNVRGGTYCQIDLLPEQKSCLNREIRGAKDLCLTCGHDNHWAKDCYVPIIEDRFCSICGYSNHLKDKCTARFDVLGRRI
jgi:hypothetical protein